MVSIDSDVFIWIGSRVEPTDILKVLQGLHTMIPEGVNVHFVHENYEPAIFTDLFPTWKNRLITRISMKKDVIHEMEEENEGDSYDSNSNSNHSQSKF